MPCMPGRKFFPCAEQTNNGNIQNAQSVDINRMGILAIGCVRDVAKPKLGQTKRCNRQRHTSVENETKAKWQIKFIELCARKILQIKCHLCMEINSEFSEYLQYFIYGSGSIDFNMGFVSCFVCLCAVESSGRRTVQT